MKNIFIHVGIHKTGSTSIQHFLDHNRGLLATNGFAYPDIFMVECAHHYLAGQLIHEGDLNVFRRHSPQNLDHDAAIEELIASDRLHRWHKFRDYLDRIPEENVILSSENFEWLTEPRLIQRLLGNHNYNIIMYLRRQDTYLESLYQQLVRDLSSRLALPIESWIARIGAGAKIHEYLPLVHRWAEVFGNNNMLLAIFEEEIKTGLEMGFLRFLGISDMARNDFVLPPKTWLQRQKAGMDVKCVEILRLCNAEKISKNEHRALLDILMDLSDQISGSSFYQKNFLPLKARKTLMEEVYHQNEEIRQEYFPESSSLFPGINEDDVPVAIAIKDLVPQLVQRCLKHSGRRRNGIR